jgi:hypothetical protein
VTYTPSANGSIHNITAVYSPSGTSADVHAGSTSAAFPVTVNKRSTSTSLSCAPIPAQINTTVTCTATVTDTDPAGTKLNPQGTVTFTKDGSPGGSCTLSNVPATTDKSSCSVSYTTPTAQVFVINATYNGSPQHASSLATSTVLVVFYDPAGGFVTGGGYIVHTSSMYPPEGAGSKDNYGFVAKYKKGTTIPEGETEFQYKPASPGFPTGMNFHSTSLDWLVVSGTRGQYQGSGTINGAGNYGFQVTVIDGGSNDKFRIKIWDKYTNAVIFDSEPGMPDTWNPTVTAAGGNIVVHKA